MKTQMTRIEEKGVVDRRFQEKNLIITGNHRKMLKRTLNTTTLSRNTNSV